MTPIDTARLPQSAVVALIAGGGSLPLEVAQALEAQGHTPKVLMIEGETTEVALSGYDHRVVPVEHFGRLPAIIRSEGITHLVLAGAVTRRPALWRVRPTLALIANIPRVVRALASGDNRLLSILIQAMERYGVTVVGVHEIVPDILAAPGVTTRSRPGAADEMDLKAAWAAAKAIGALDIGQAAVAIGGRAVEVEGVEGTAGLLARVEGIRGHGRLAGKTGGVLVKCVKPGQELRADLPTIGPDTVDAAHAAGLRGIGVEAWRSLILQSHEVVARADRLGLFVIGIEGGE